MNEGIGEPDIMQWRFRTTPLFWMDEQTGMMKTIVEKFFEEIHLTNLELKYLRWYIVQWIDGMVSFYKVYFSEKEIEEYMKYGGITKNYKKQLGEMDQEQIAKYLNEELIEKGIDPF